MGVRVDVNVEVKFFYENSKHFFLWGSGRGGGVRSGSGWWEGGGGVQDGCERNVGGRG